MSPDAILTAVHQMLEKAIDMDSGRYSELSESILYVTRLAIRVEGYLLFLVRNKQFHSNHRTSTRHVPPSVLRIQGVEHDMLYDFSILSGLLMD